MLDQKKSTGTKSKKFLNDVIHGLRQPKKSIPCKYFYDEQGSQLFEQICEVEEYYLTDCELEIMEQHADEISECVIPGSTLLEFGSGSSLKTRYLLDSMRGDIVYVPVDVSAKHLQQSVEKLRVDYPQMTIEPVVADFTKPITLPECVSKNAPVTIYFPGSTIGNFSPSGSERLFEMMANEIGNKGGLILGVDLVKDPETIELAYNDLAGITAKFNLNLLTRINRELDGDFELEQFAHQSIYNEAEERIETSLVSRCDQVVSVADESFQFESGEEIHTEYSHKYSIESISRAAAGAGFTMKKYWTDSKKYFAVIYFEVEGQN